MDRPQARGNTAGTLAVAPLAGGRLDPPDIALFYATPGAMIYFINSLQWSGYKRFDWSIVGESACADSWGRALKTRQPSLSIPYFAERRYGGVLDDELLMALPPDDTPKRSPAWKRSPRTAYATPSHNTASNRMSAPAWRSATPPAAADLCGSAPIRAPPGRPKAGSFCSRYATAAEAGGWDRTSLECPLGVSGQVHQL